MENHAVAELDPLVLWDQRDQDAFDFDGIVVLAPTHATRQSPDMSIDRDAWNIKGVAENDIRRLAPHARQWHQLFHGLRDLPAVLFDENPTTLADIASLVAKETRRLDHPLQFANIRRRIGFSIGKAAEKRRRYLVDALI